MAIELTVALVESLAPKSDVLSDARSIVRQGKLSKPQKTADGSLLWGLVKGSGKEPYSTSVDLGANPERPVMRCSCPSRIHPCKHCVALMVAFTEGKGFAEKEAPKDLLEKREKYVARGGGAEEAKAPPKEESPEKRAAREAKAEATKKAAAAKKTEMQREALDVLEKFLLDLVATGLGGLNAKSHKAIDEQARRMNDADLRGAHALLRQLIDAATSVGDSAPTKSTGRKKAKKKGAADDEAPESEERGAADMLAQRHARLALTITRLWVALRKGRKVLDGKLEEGDSQSESDAQVESLLGRAWKLPELQERGYWINDKTFIELAHEKSEDRVLEMLAHKGYLLDLADGAVHTEWTGLPFVALRQAAASLRQARQHVLAVREAALYPGDVVNRRVRWDEKSGALSEQPRTSAEYDRVRALARPFDTAIKLFREQLKNPLSPLDAVLLLAVKNIGRAGANVVIEDGAGARIVLRDAPNTFSTMDNLLHAAGAFGAGPMAVRLWFDPNERLIYGQPLALFAGDRHLRLGL